MLRAVSAAALWLLAVGSGLCVPAEASSEPGFTDCSHSFYRHSPPQGSAAGPLRPLCHSGPGGQSFATLYQPNCDSAVYSAFHLSNGLAVSTEDKGAGIVSKESVKVVVPALLQGNSDGSQLSPAASHLQQWDSTVTTRIQSSFGPQCHTLGGDLYVLIGAGRLKPIGDENKECQGKLLWSAVCCAVTQGKGFSAAFIKETEGEERQVKVKELQDMLGVTELFSEGCGDVQTKKVLTPQRHSGSILASAAEVPQTEEVHADNGDQTIHKEEVIEETVSSTKAHATSEEQPDDSESTNNGQVTNERDSEESKDSEDSEDSISEIVAELSEETVEEEETDDNSTSTVLYVLSTTLYILKAPLHPLVSTVAELPGQVMYVLQEDLGVLSALPGETYLFFHLLISDTFSWIGSAADLLLSIGEAIFSRVYFCTSSMGEALWDSCYTGVTGMGTLAGDTLGIFGDVLDNAWWVTTFFGGWLFEQSGEYAGTVVGEIGGQAKAVGGGLGNLAWSGGKGVGNVFKFGEGIVWRLGGKIFGSGTEAERQEESVSLSEKIEEIIAE